MSKIFAESPRLAAIRARGGELARAALEATGRKFTRSGDELRGPVPWRAGSDGNALAVEISTGLWYDHKEGERPGVKQDALGLLARLESLPTDGPDFITRTVARAEALLGIIPPPPTHGDPLARWAALRSFSRDALAAVGAKAEKRHAVAIPMRNDTGEVIGHRRRRADRSLWKWKGSEVKVISYRGDHSGLVYNPEHTTAPGRDVYLVEGETDLLALLTARPDAVAFATPSANPGPACFGFLEALLLRSRADRAVAFADNDKAGKDWLARIAEACLAADLPLAVAALPPEAKDLDAALAAVELASDRPDALAAWVDGAVSFESLLTPAAVADADGEAPQGENPKPTRFIGLQDWLATPPSTAYVVKGLLPAAGLCQLFAPPNVGKSFVAIDIAGHVATGQTWHGHRVTRGPVVYFASEGHNGLKARFAAWVKERNGGNVPDNVAIFPWPVGLTDPAAAQSVAAEMLATLKGPPRLLIIDTLAGHFGPGDENASQDMNVAVLGLQSLQGDGCLLAIHHSGHAETGRSRGSSVFNCALDVSLRLERKTEDDPIALTITKNRDGRKDLEKYFTLESVDLPWTDDDGDPINSAVLVEADPPEKAVKLCSHQADSLAAIRSTIEASPDLWITVEQARAAIRAKGIYKSQNKIPKTIEKLVSDGMLLMEEGKISWP